jgi:hypothetical protein
MLSSATGFNSSLTSGANRKPPTRLITLSPSDGYAIHQGRPAVRLPCTTSTRSALMKASASR